MDTRKPNKRVLVDGFPIFPRMAFHGFVKAKDQIVGVKMTPGKTENTNKTQVESQKKWVPAMGSQWPLPLSGSQFPHV